MGKLFSIPAEHETWLWSKYVNNTCEQLTKSHNTLFHQSQVLKIELPNEDSPWLKLTPVTKESDFS